MLACPWWEPSFVLARAVPRSPAVLPLVRATCRNSYQDVCILRDMKTHVPVLEIRILECRGELMHGVQPPLPFSLHHRLLWGVMGGKAGMHLQHHCPSLAEQGYNVRLRGIKFKSFWERDLNLNADMFQMAQLVRYPLLEGVDTDVLYRRAVVIQRYSMGTATGQTMPWLLACAVLKTCWLLSCMRHRLCLVVPHSSIAAFSACRVLYRSVMGPGDPAQHPHPSPSWSSGSPSSWTVSWGT